MATGIEVWLGYTYLEYHENAPPDAPRVPWPLPTDGSEDGPREEWPEQFDVYAATLRDKLRQAWFEAVKQMGWGKPKPSPKCPLILDYHKVATPAGAWEFSPFSLYKQFGGEMEFDFPDVPIGVPLSRRYKPTFLDYASSSGTLPNPFVLYTQEFMHMTAIATKCITDAVPWLIGAKLMIVECHY